MINNSLNRVTYVNVVKWWLTGVLLILPFQMTIANTQMLWGNETLAFIRYLDEITIIVFFPLTIIEFYRKKEIRDWLYLVLSLSLGLIFIISLVSGTINGNYLYVTVSGAFDYIRNFLIVFIYAAFFREFSDFNKIFRLLLIMAVLIGVVAFLQELWAITSNYFIEENNQSKLFLILKDILPDYYQYTQRFGIYRMVSLMHNSLFLGIYCLFILTIYLYTTARVRFLVFLTLFSGIFVSVSRMAYIGFIVISGLQILRTKGKRTLLILAVFPILILMFKLSFLWDFNISGLIEGGSVFGKNEDNMISYREYTGDKAMQIWKDHPIWGVGPGMFGGIISVETNSYIYEEYDFMATSILRTWKHIDQYWPQILAEIGIIGAAYFAGLFISLFVVLFIARKRTTSHEMKGLFTGCGAFLIVVLLYSLGSTINIAQIIFPYFAFIGMGLGCLKINST